VRREWLRSSLWGLSVAALLAGLSSQPNTSPTVAWIDHFEGKPGDYTIVQQGKPSEPPPCCWTALSAGDSIIVHREGVGIYITFGGGKPLKVCLNAKTTNNCDKESPFVVQAVSPSGVVSTLMKWVGDYLTGWHLSPHPKGETDLKIKGSGITTALLEGQKVQIGSGDRKIGLSWSGGTAPYEIAIYVEDRSAALLSLKGVSEREFFGSAVHLNPGRYVLEIADSAGQRFTKNFNVVDSSRIPQDPEIEKTGLSVETKSTMDAAWLAGLGDGLWVWEAYLRASELAPTYPPAMVLRDALAAGALPPSRFSPVSKDGLSPSDEKPQLVVQLGHYGYVKSVAFSPNGRLVLTGGADGSVCLWDVRSGREIRRFRGHSDSVKSVTFSPDGRLVLTGSEDGTARIWDAATGRQIQKLVTTSAVLSASFSPDGRWVLTAGENPNARLWDAATAREVRKWQVHPGQSSSAAFSPDGQLVLIRTNGDMELWNREKGDEILHFQVAAASPGPVVFSPDGRFILAEVFGHGAILFDAKTGAVIREFAESSFSVISVAFSADGRFVLTAGSSQVNPSDPSWKDGNATVWDAGTGQLTRRVVISGRDSWGPNTTSSVAFSPDGRFFLTGSFDGVTRLWKAGTGEVALRFDDQASAVTTIAMSSDRQSLVTGGWDGVSHRWNLSSGEESNHLKGDGTLVYSIAISPDSKSVLIGSAGNHTLLYDAASGKEIRSFDGPRATVESVSFAPDARSALSAVFDGTVRTWSIESGEQIRRFTVQRPPYAGAFSPGGRFFAAGMRGSRDSDVSSRDFTVHQWNTDTAQEMSRLTGHSAYIESVAYSPDGQQIVTTSADQTTRVWEASTGREVRRFATGPASRAAFSPDGGSILTGSPDGTTLLWSLETGKEILRLQGDSSGAVDAVAFSLDGRFFLTGGSDSATHVWDRSRGQELCQLISFHDGTWVVVDPDGRFDTNNLEEIRGLDWVLPDAPFTPLPIEIFMRDYYEPRLLPRLLAGDEFDPVKPLAGLNRAQPVVQINSIVPQPDHPDHVTVAVQVSRGIDPATGKAPQSANAAVFDLRLFRDGQLVRYAPQAEDDAAHDQLNLGPSGTSIFTFDNIPLPHRASSEPFVFSAYAFNSDRVKSQTARMIYRPSVPLHPVRGRAYIICFGVNYNEDPALRLDEAANDARALLHSVADALDETKEFEKVVGILLVSDDVRQDGGVAQERTATRDNLHAVLDRLAGHTLKPPLLSNVAAASELRKATPDDLIILTLSSHGELRESRGGRDFFIVPFLPAGTSPKSPDYVSHLISSDDLSRWLRDVDAGELDMIIDSCFSASAVETPTFKPGPMGSRGLGQLSYDKGMRILAATQANDVALESSKLGLSMLTYALVHDGLQARGADTDPQDGVITTSKWLRYGAEQVPQMHEGVERPKLFDFSRSHVETILLRQK
jgi:WD40 repeat protein